MQEKCRVYELLANFRGDENYIKYARSPGEQKALR